MRRAGPEREVKLSVPSLADAERRLLAAGAFATGPPARETNTLHDDDAASLRLSDRLLRVRSHRAPPGARDGPPALLTFKGPARVEGGLKVREEVETEVSDAEATRLLLARLGLAETFRYEKRRLVLRLGDAELALDETPLGAFVEVEGLPADVDRVGSILGVGDEARETRSYPRLWRERHGDPAPDMLLGSDR